MTLPRMAALFAALAISASPALAADKAADKAAPAAKDPVMATVDRDSIHASDVQKAVAGLPPQAVQGAPPELIAGKMLEQLVARKALLIEATKMGLAKDPDVKRQIQEASEQIITQALLKKQVGPSLTEENVKAIYDKDYAHQPGEPEVHARHILVDSEDKAKDIIAQIKAGAKFEDLAKKFGDPKDPASQQGGDLGFFKKGDMLPEFSDVAFKLKVNEVSDTPVKTRYGYHVIQVLETRMSQPPAYDQVRQEISQKLIQDGVAKAVENAKKQVKVVMFNPDGTPIKEEKTAPAKK